MNIVAVPSVLTAAARISRCPNCSARRMAFVPSATEASQSRLSMRSCASTRYAPASCTLAAQPLEQLDRPAARGVGFGVSQRQHIEQRELAQILRFTQGAVRAPMQLTQTQARGDGFGQLIGQLAFARVGFQPGGASRRRRRRSRVRAPCDSGPPPPDAHRVAAPGARPQAHASVRRCRHRLAWRGAPGARGRPACCPLAPAHRSTSACSACATGSESDLSIATRASSCRKHSEDASAISKPESKHSSTSATFAPSSFSTSQRSIFAGNDRGELDDCLRARAQSREPREHQVLHAAGHTVEAMPEQLGHEERIALGRRVDAGRRPQRASRKQLDRIRRKPRQIDAGHEAARQLAEHAPQRVCRRQLIVAIGNDQQTSACDRCADRGT